jgi:hypothetical protein
MRGLGLCALALGLFVSSCLADPNAARTDADLDEAYFRCNVQPVLTRSCSMFACHGNARRFFVVFARNRLRDGIASEAQRASFLTDEERERNFIAARAMVVPGHPEQSSLLMKPLDPSAGGWYHVGGDVPFHGGDPFSSVDDPDYQTLQMWVMGARADDPDCIEPGSDL